jgi:hypothetical protein
MCASALISKRSQPVGLCSQPGGPLYVVDHLGWSHAGASNFGSAVVGLGNNSSLLQPNQINTVWLKYVNLFDWSWMLPNTPQTKGSLLTVSSADQLCAPTDLECTQFDLTGNTIQLQGFSLGLEYSNTSAFYSELSIKE